MIEQEEREKYFVATFNGSELESVDWFYSEESARLEVKERIKLYPKEECFVGKRLA